MTGGATGFQLTGTQILDTVYGNSLVNIARVANATVVFDAAGNLVKFDTVLPTSVQMRGNDAGVAWGTFTDPGAPGTLTHFVAGIPVPTADLTNLAGTISTYSLIGSTPVTNSAGQAIGTLDSASLRIHLTPGNGNPASADMNWTIQGSPLSASLSGTGSTPPYFSINGNCGGGCTVSAGTALFGANANRAGMVYSIQGTSPLPAEMLGAAMFAK